MSDSSKTTQVCPECKSEEDWRGASWCPSCGYYPAIKRQVAASAVEPEEEHVYDHWWEVIPSWVWVTVAGCGVLLVVSVAARVIFADSIVRTWWTYGQMGLGIVAMCTAHFMAYLYGVSKSDKLGPLDMFMRPIATWQPVLMGLPESSRLVSLMGCSICAIALGFFVVDGIDYLGIMQADAAARKKEQAAQAAKDKAEGKKKTSAMGMILQTAGGVAQAKNALSGNDGSGPESLEDALHGFAGETGLTEGGALGDLANGGDGGGGAGGLGGAIAGLSGVAGGMDVDGYMEEQEAKAGGLTDHSEASESEPTSSEVAGSSSKGASGVNKSGRGTGAGTSPVSISTGASNTDRQENVDPLSAVVRQRDELECLVLGYTTNTTGEIRSLLLAAAPDRRLLRFVAKVPVEQVDPELLQWIVQKFGEIPARQPMVRCPFGGRWLQPEVFCIASYEGWTADNRLNNAVVHRLVNVAQSE